MSQEIRALTEKFHETYERLAYQFNYSTREDTREFDPESTNGRLMLAVVEEVIGPVLTERDKLKAELADTVPRTRYDACNQDWLDSKRELEHVREVAKVEIDELKAEVERQQKELTTLAMMERRA